MSWHWKLERDCKHHFSSLVILKEKQSQNGEGIHRDSAGEWKFKLSHPSGQSRAAFQTAWALLSLGSAPMQPQVRPGQTFSKCLYLTGGSTECCVVKGRAGWSFQAFFRGELFDDPIRRNVDSCI